jgi:hypothetical protein
MAGAAPSGRKVRRADQHRLTSPTGRGQPFFLNMTPDQFKISLEEFLTTDVDQLWLVEDDVYFDGGWSEFHDSFDTSDADLLATDVRTRLQSPDWHWWNTLGKDGLAAAPETGVAALLPLVRFSRPAAQAVLDGMASQWAGHPEALIPTLVSEAGLKIEDIGGTGTFTPEERLGKWYDERTWHWSGPVKHVPGLVHFPVPRQHRALAPTRVVPRDGTENPQMLYISPVGAGAQELLPKALDVFRGAGADVLLLHYDSTDFHLPADVRSIHYKDYKWPLAVRHLHPDNVLGYDYIFFWDDDLDVSGFDPVRFVSIMKANRLDMAQPSILSPHGLSHAITRHRPCRVPFRSETDEEAHPVVGRITNFVEIMAPVFTGEAWREFYGYLDPGNTSGWGYDYIPLARKGIVDTHPIVHTRAVQSITPEAEKDIKKFLDHQGLFRFQPVEQGWLFE